MKRYFHLAILFVFAIAGVSFLNPGMAQQPSKVGLVVQFLDGTIEKHCVEFEGDEIHGYDVLVNSGIEFVSDYNGSAGAAICKIGQDGCPADNCFCSMPNYWSYWHWLKNKDGKWEWTYSPIGASNYLVQPGQVEAWRFGAGTAPEITPVFEEICRPSTSTPTFTPATGRAVTSYELSPTKLSTAIIISNPTADIPVNTSTPIPSPVPPTQTPLPSPTAQVLAMQVVFTEAPAPTVVSIEPAAPTPGAAIEATIENKKSGEVKKPTRTPDNLPAKRAGIALQSSGTLTANTALDPSSEGRTLDHDKQKGSTVAKLVFMTGGIAGLLSFMAFFGVLSVGLLIVLVRKRR